MTIKKIKAEDTWKIRHIVMWPDKPIEFVKLENDPAGLHFGLFDEGELCSVVSCFERKDEMQFRKLATLQDKQKRGFASSLLRHILDMAEKWGIKRVWCNARVNKKGYYEKFGFKDTNEKYSKGGIDFTIMELWLDK